MLELAMKLPPGALIGGAVQHRRYLGIAAKVTDPRRVVPIVGGAPPNLTGRL